MQDFRKIKVWHESRAFTVAVYKVTSKYPESEMFGLVSQFRRSAGAIGNNIAEGFGKATRTDCARCIQTSISEAGESLHQLIVSRDLEYISQEQFEALELQLTTLRRRVYALYFKIRPAGKTRRNPKRRSQSGPKAGKSGRNAGQSGPKAG